MFGAEPECVALAIAGLLAGVWGGEIGYHFVDLGYLKFCL